MIEQDSHLRFPRGIWSEHVPYEHLLEGALLDQLAARRIELILGVHPADVPAVGRVLRACAARGLAVSLWPLLDDCDGRWLNEWTAATYVRHVRRIVAALPPEARGIELVLDLEPPIDVVRKALQGLRVLPWILRSSRRSETRERIAALSAELRAHGLGASAVVAPFVLWDTPRDRGMERLLGTPVGDLAFERVWVMAYTSLLEGYSAGLLGRADARALLWHWSREAVRRFGARAGVAVGLVGGGALGDERRYRGPGELREDLAAVHAAGAERVALYGLAGILSRPPVERWLDGLVRPAVSVPPPAPTAKSRLSVRAGRALSRTVSRTRTPFAMRSRQRM